MGTDYRDAMVEMAGNEMEKLREQNIKFRAALGSLYTHGTVLPAREGVQALIDAGQIRKEDLIL